MEVVEFSDIYGDRSFVELKEAEKQIMVENCRILGISLSTVMKLTELFDSMGGERPITEAKINAIMAKNI